MLMTANQLALMFSAVERREFSGWIGSDDFKSGGKHDGRSVPMAADGAHFCRGQIIYVCALVRQVSNNVVSGVSLKSRFRSGEIRQPRKW